MIESRTPNISFCDLQWIIRPHNRRHHRRESGLDWRTYELRSMTPLDRLVLPHMLRYWSGAIARQRSEAEEYRYPMTVTTNTGQIETILFDVNISALSTDRDSIEKSEAWALATQAVLDLHDEVTAQGAHFLLVYVPTKEHIYWGRLWDERDIGHVLDAPPNYEVTKSSALILTARCYSWRNLPPPTTSRFSI